MLTHWPARSMPYAPVGYTFLSTLLYALIFVEPYDCLETPKFHCAGPFVWKRIQIWLTGPIYQYIIWYWKEKAIRISIYLKYELFYFIYCSEKAKIHDTRTPHWYKKRRMMTIYAVGMEAVVITNLKVMIWTKKKATNVVKGKTKKRKVSRISVWISVT